MRCVNAYFKSQSLRLFDEHVEIDFGVVTDVAMDRMPDVRTLEQAKEWIFKTMQPLKPGSVVMFYPQYSSFSLVESFLVLKTVSGMLCIYGIQVKAGRNTPNTNVAIPDWMDRVVLIRGDAPATCTERQDRFVYMSKSQTENLLGYSLRSLYPANWRSDS
jgi:hypothetical protein